MPQGAKKNFSFKRNPLQLMQVFLFLNLLQRKKRKRERRRQATAREDER